MISTILNIHVYVHVYVLFSFFCTVVAVLCCYKSTMYFFKLFVLCCCYLKKKLCCSFFVLLWLYVLCYYKSYMQHASNATMTRGTVTLAVHVLYMYYTCTYPYCNIMLPRCLIKINYLFISLITLYNYQYINRVVYPSNQIKHNTHTLSFTGVSEKCVNKI